MKLKSNIRLATCCCTHAATYLFYELSGFYIIQKGVQNLLKMNLQNCFIKEKGKHLFFSLIPWIWPAGLTSRHPPRFRRPKRVLPLLSLGQAKLARARPLPGLAHRPARTPAMAADALGRALYR
jgi:hypothetical protein